MTAIIVTAQGHDTAGRRKTCARASTASDGAPGKRQRMNSYGSASITARWTEDPQNPTSELDVRDNRTPA